jgi:tRNA-dihydrouridine synthase
VFDEAYDALPPASRHAYRTRVIARHVALIQDHCDDRYALVQVKKHLSWYTDGLGHARECRVAIFQARAVDEVWEIFQRYTTRAEREPAPALEAATA